MTEKSKEKLLAQAMNTIEILTQEFPEVFEWRWKNSLYKFTVTKEAIK